MDINVLLDVFQRREARNHTTSIGYVTIQISSC